MSARIISLLLDKLGMSYEPLHDDVEVPAATDIASAHSLCTTHLPVARPGQAPSSGTDKDLVQHNWPVRQPDEPRVARYFNPGPRMVLLVLISLFLYPIVVWGFSILVSIIMIGCLILAFPITLVVLYFNSYLCAASCATSPAACPLPFSSRRRALELIWRVCGSSLPAPDEHH